MIYLAPFINFDDFTQTIYFNGSQSSAYLAGKVKAIKISIITSTGIVKDFTQVVIFDE